jgi:hypothetical protein
VKQDIFQPNHAPDVAWQAAAQAGIDMTQLEANLRKTPWERLCAHRRARRIVLELKLAVEKRHARS